LLEPFEKFVLSFIPAGGDRRVRVDSFQSVAYSMNLPNMFHALLPAAFRSPDEASLCIIAKPQT
jgi:hypothetical protein